jgi:hypothetical protein
MTGELAHAKAVVDLGFHVLQDGTTYNVEYRNRSMRLIHPINRYDDVTVSGLWFDKVDWTQLLSSELSGYPEALGDVERLEKALNYLSMYESGISEMMSLINIRQTELLLAENKVIPARPLHYLTNLTGQSELASWSTTTVSNTTWT